MHDGVMQSEPALRHRPVRLLASCGIHAREPEFPSHFGFGRIGHVDGDQNVIRESVQQGRGIGPPSAGIPDPVQPAALHRHEPDLARGSGIFYVVDRHARRPVLHPCGMLDDLAFVIGLFVGNVGLGKHVLVVDHQQRIVLGLQMQAPGVRRRGDLVNRTGLYGVAHVDDAEPVGKDVPDIGMVPVHHQPHGVGTTALVTMSDQPHVVLIRRGGQGPHGASIATVPAPRHAAAVQRRAAFRRSGSGCWSPLWSPGRGADGSGTFPLARSSARPWG